MRTITLLLLTFFSLHSIGQTDSISQPLVDRFEYDFVFSNGILQKSVLEPVYGKEHFIPYTNHIWNGQVLVTKDLGANFKFGTGLVFGKYGFKFGLDFKQSDYPFLPEDFQKGGQHEFYSYPNSNVFVGIPFRLSYNLLQQEKYQLWLEAGIDLYYLHLPFVPAYYTAYYDTTDIDMFYMPLKKNRLRTQLELGLQYRYQLPNYHELIFGVSASYNSQAHIIGNYTLFPTTIGIHGQGSFSHYFNHISVDLGYSMNNRKYREKNPYKKTKKKKRRNQIPDTISDKNELRLGFNLKSLGLYSLQQDHGVIKPTQKLNDCKVYNPEVLFVRYFKENWAWYSGVSLQYFSDRFYLDYSKYSSSVFDYDNYRRVLDYYSYGVTFGAFRQYEINPKSTLEIGGNILISNGSYYYNHYHDMRKILIKDPNGLFKNLFKEFDFDHNLIDPTLRLNAAYAYNTKNQNKWIIGARLAYSLTSYYDINYELVQPDGSYEKGLISYQPLTFTIYMQHAFTYKRKRFLESMMF